MNEEAEFHRNIIENPTDITAPLVYADWLEEHGNRPATAEMIRRGISDARRISGYGGNNSTTGLREVGEHPFELPHSMDVGVGVGGGRGRDTRDIVALHLPIGSKHFLRLDPYMKRPDSKRLISQLQEEGHPEPEYSNRDEFTNDTTDYSNEPPSPQMFRRRDSLRKKYAVSTVGRVFGQGKSDSDIAQPMVGTRLATVLHEINSGVGKSNPKLAQLTQHALGGSHKPELYTSIRDELFRTKDPRAVALARQYNWHKVGEGLERDKHLRDFVKSSAEGTKHQNHHQMYRRFYNGVVHGKNGPDENTRNLFYQHMRNYLKKQTGKEHSYEHVEDSLCRLGETEENHEHLLRNKNLKPQSKFEVPDYETPAYRGVPQEGKYPRKEQTTPRSKLHVGQYKRRRWSYRPNEQ